LIATSLLIAPAVGGSELSPSDIEALPPYVPDQPPPVGLPGKAHHTYRYDQINDRVVFGGSEYVLHEKAGTLNDPDIHVLYERDISGGPTRTVFTLPGRVVGAYSVSPDGRYIALRSWVDEDLGSTALHVIDREGKEIARIGKVWDYSWSPDGNQLAYVTGDYHVAGDGDEVRPTGVWRYDLRQRASTKLQDAGRHVAWAAFDRAVYVLDYSGPNGYPRVWRLNSADWKPQLTSFQGIYLSPTGKYYYPPGGEGRFDVYDVATNTPRFATSSLRERFAWGTEPIGWMDSGGNHLLLLTWSNPVTGQLDTHPHTMMYDLDAGTMVDLELENVIGWKHGTFVIVREGKFQNRKEGAGK
ncbi:MAG TPA: hypothetical protein VJL88_14040, partial [Nitrospira sp.]|nr:hypothetical protein [Nitrospira sp.]